MLHSCLAVVPAFANDAYYINKVRQGSLFAVQCMQAVACHWIYQPGTPAGWCCCRPSIIRVQHSMLAVLLLPQLTSPQKPLGLPRAPPPLAHRSSRGCPSSPTATCSRATSAVAGWCWNFNACPRWPCRSCLCCCCLLWHLSLAELHWLDKQTATLHMQAIKYASAFVCSFLEESAVYLADEPMSDVEAMIWVQVWLRVREVRRPRCPLACPGRAAAVLLVGLAEMLRCNPSLPAMLVPCRACPPRFERPSLWGWLRCGRRCTTATCRWAWFEGKQETELLPAGWQRAVNFCCHYCLHACASVC